MSELLSQNITLAAELLAAGSLVIFPTETVYGLGADARNENAVRNIFRSKKRPANHPLIVHIGSIEEIEEWAIDISAAAYQCSEKFWPGPLTIVLKKHPSVSTVITGGQNTIAIRMPKHPVARDLLQTFGSGVAAPSANLFTQLSPTKTAAIDPALLSEVALVLEGGQCDVGLESTILDMSTERLRILRPGMIDVKTLELALGGRVEAIIAKESDRVPGMHPIHYAPKTRTRLVSKADLDSLEMLADDTVVVHHSALDFNSSIRSVRMPDDPAEYAHALYRSLHELDRSGFQQILIETVPEDHTWDAIRDRITKASAR